MPERRSIEICLDTKQKMTGLEVIARLYAANEFGEAAVEIVVWNIQIAACPRTPDIRADIKSRPVIGRRGNGSRRCFRRNVGGVSDSGPTDRREHTNSQKQVLHGVPEGDATRPA